MTLDDSDSSRALAPPVGCCCCRTVTVTLSGRLRATVEVYYDRLHKGRFSPDPLPLPDDAIAELGGVPAPVSVQPGSWPARISGTPDQMVDMLRTIGNDLQADEIIIQDQIADHAERMHSYELLGGVMDHLTPSIAL